MSPWTRPSVLHFSSFSIPFPFPALQCPFSPPLLFFLRVPHPFTQISIPTQKVVVPAAPKSSLPKGTKLKIGAPIKPKVDVHTRICKILPFSFTCARLQPDIPTLLNKAPCRIRPRLRQARSVRPPTAIPSRCVASAASATRT